MLVAALDTATLTLSCALLDLIASGPPKVRCERSERAPAQVPGGSPAGHGARLPAALNDLLVAEGLDLAAVEGYAVGLGPGSFTGLRIGLATWKGLAYANRRPVAGVSSLAAMALAAAPAAPEGVVLVPLLDAKKGEVYAGFYRRSGGGGGILEARPPAALAPGALLEVLAGLGGAALGFGEGYAAFREALAGGLPEIPGGPSTPSAEAVGRLAASRLGDYDEPALFALEPHYVRPSEAEVKFPKGFVSGPVLRER